PGEAQANSDARVHDQQHAETSHGSLLHQNVSWYRSSQYNRLASSAQRRVAGSLCSNEGVRFSLNPNQGLRPVAGNHARRFVQPVQPFSDRPFDRLKVTAPEIRSAYTSL